MSDPTKNEVTWSKILKINVQCIAAVLVLTYGWFFWSRASLEWYGFWVIGFCGLAGGIGMLASALFESGKLIHGYGRWMRYRRSGKKQRDDKMASESDILNRKDAS
jgi:hypothetical protein